MDLAVTNDWTEKRFDYGESCESVKTFPYGKICCKPYNGQLSFRLVSQLTKRHLWYFQRGGIYADELVSCSENGKLCGSASTAKKGTLYSKLHI